LEIRKTLEEIVQSCAETPSKRLTT